MYNTKSNKIKAKILVRNTFKYVDNGCVHTEKFVEGIIYGWKSL